MRKITSAPPLTSGWSHIITALLFLTLGHSLPVAAAENTQLSAVEPKVSSPQGTLTVYSERYVNEDEEKFIPHRRSVEIYNEQGHFVASRCGTDTGASHFDLPPGHYIVVSESYNTFAKVHVDIKDGEETVVPELLIELIALNPSSLNSAATVHVDSRFCPDLQGDD